VIKQFRTDSAVIKQFLTDVPEFAA